MASRLYRTTRRLYSAVAVTLRYLGVSDLGQPTAAVLMVLYVTGFVLPDTRQVA